jgi:hypothetical protein
MKKSTKAAAKVSETKVATYTHATMNLVATVFEVETPNDRYFRVVGHGVDIAVDTVVEAMRSARNHVGYAVGFGMPTVRYFNGYRSFVERMLRNVAL